MTYQEWIKWLEVKTGKQLATNATAAQLKQTYVPSSTTGATNTATQQAANSNLMGTATSLAQTGYGFYTGAQSKAQAKLFAKSQADAQAQQILRDKTLEFKNSQAGLTNANQAYKTNINALNANVADSQTFLAKDYSRLTENAHTRATSLLNALGKQDKVDIVGLQNRIDALSKPTGNAAIDMENSYKAAKLENILKPYQADIDGIKQAETNEIIKLDRTRDAALDNIAKAPDTRAEYAGTKNEAQEKFDAAKKELEGTPGSEKPGDQPGAPGQPGTPGTPTPPKQNFMQRHADGLKAAMAGAAAAGGGIGLFKTIGDMTKNGASMQGILGAGTSLVALVGGLASLHSNAISLFGGMISHGGFIGNLGGFLGGSLHFLTTPWGIAAVVAAIVVYAIVSSLFGAKPTPEELEMDKFNKLTVWMPGNVLMMTSAAAFLSMGYNIDKPMDLNSAGIPIETMKLQTALSQSIVNADGSAFKGAIPYGVPLVLKGENGAQDRVIILSQKGVGADRKSYDSIKVITLAEGTSWGVPEKDSNGVDVYLPFAVDGVLNEQATMSVTQQRALLQAQKALSANAAKTAAAIAASANKQVVRN